MHNDQILEIFEKAKHLSLIRQQKSNRNVFHSLRLCKEVSLYFQIKFFEGLLRDPQHIDA